MENIPLELRINERNRVLGRTFTVLNAEVLAIGRFFDDDVPTLDDTPFKRQIRFTRSRLIGVPVAQHERIGLRTLVIHQVQTGKTDTDKTVDRGIPVARIQCRVDVDRSKIRPHLRAVIGSGDERRLPVLNVLRAVVGRIDRTNPSEILSVGLAVNTLVEGFLFGGGSVGRESTRGKSRERGTESKGEDLALRLLHWNSFYFCVLNGPEIGSHPHPRRRCADAGSSDYSNLETDLEKDTVLSNPNLFLRVRS